jgi:hypothetical protein
MLTTLIERLPPQMGLQVHPARPTHCRVYPFKATAVASAHDWAAEASVCPGIDRAYGYTRHAPTGLDNDAGVAGEFDVGSGLANLPAAATIKPAQASADERPNRGDGDVGNSARLSCRKGRGSLALPPSVLATAPSTPPTVAADVIVGLVIEEQSRISVCDVKFVHATSHEPSQIGLPLGCE